MRKKLKEGKLENKHFSRCRQTQCSFFRNGGCQECADCKTEPFLIKKSCDRCVRCEKVPNSLRWGDKKETEAVSELMEKIFEVMEKAQPQEPQIIFEEEPKMVLVEIQKTR